MQPYFVPYLGYFRLFAAADVFVVLDSVQFPSDGYVHRNRLPDETGVPRWLKLPLRKMPLHTRICDLAFHPDAVARLQAQLDGFPSLGSGRAEAAEFVRLLLDIGGEPVGYLMRTLRHVGGLLDLPWRIIRSSEMPIAPELRGEARVIEIVRQLGGTVYVNSPGGRRLYDATSFRNAGMALRFLSDYQGPPWSVLWRMATEPPEALRAEVAASTVCVE
jgi:hypothetical protein